MARRGIIAVRRRLPAAFRFTGQRLEAGLAGAHGLYFYNARWYDPALGRFISADTMVPSPGNPQSLNRYSYTLNNPVRYTDPTGHWEDEAKNTQASSCTPRPVCIFTGRHLATQPDPWSSLVDTLEGEAKYKQHSASAGQLFLEDIVSPWAGEFGPFGGPNTLGGAGRHPAVDSRGGRLGASIHAAAYGKVVSVGDNGNTDFGKFIVIEHDVYGVKFYSVYAHLDTQNVFLGDIVDNTTQIGTMGQSGTNNVHLHFEVRKAVNVDVSQNNPFAGKVWWPGTRTELGENFLNLGPIFGYGPGYSQWANNNP